MTSFRVGIISSMRMSGGKPRSSKAGSGRAPASDKQKEQSDVRMCIREPQSVDVMVDTFGALAECVGLHAEGGAEAFPVTEAGRFGLLGGTFLHGLDVTCELPARPNRRPCVWKANALEDTQFLAGIERKRKSIFNQLWSLGAPSEGESARWTSSCLTGGVTHPLLDKYVNTRKQTTFCLQLWT